MAQDDKTGWDLWALDMTRDPPRAQPIVNKSFNERNGQLSPDGLWLVYETDVSGLPQIVVASFADPARQWPVSRSGGTQPRWHPDGNELYFVAPDGTLMAAPVTTRNQAGASSLDVGTPAALFPTRILAGNRTGFAQYAVSRDGRFLIFQPAESTTSPLMLLLNWRSPASSELPR
jgi:Tol biopolymer transport system component